jgi:hypothetical protein
MIFQINCYYRFVSIVWIISISNFSLQYIPTDGIMETTIFPHRIMTCVIPVSKLKYNTFTNEATRKSSTIVWKISGGLFKKILLDAWYTLNIDCLLLKRLLSDQMVDKFYQQVIETENYNIRLGFTSKDPPVTVVDKVSQHNHQKCISMIQLICK